MKPLYLAPPLLLAAIGLTACGPMVQIGGNNTPPAELLTLTASQPTSVPVGLKPIDVKTAVTVDIPSTPGALQTLRIPVTVTDTSIQYVTGSQWSEQPNRLFQRVLADKITANGIAVIDQRSSGQIAGRRLTGQLLAFGVDVRNNPQAVIRYDATLNTQNGVRQRRFERSQPISAVEGALVSAALNKLSNEIADDIALWVGKEG